MRRFRTLFFQLAAAFVFAPVGIVAQEGALSLSVQDALAMAAKNNFDVRVQRLYYDQYELRYAASQGVYDPVLSFNWGTGTSRSPISSVLQVGGATSSYNTSQDYYNLGLSQATPWGQTVKLQWNNTQNESNSTYTLFNPTYTSNLLLSTTVPILQGFGRPVADLARKRALLDWQASQFQYSQSLRDSLLQVERSYWDLVYSREALEVSRSGLKLAQEFQGQTAARIKAGVLAPIEQISADASVAQREQEIVVAEALSKNSEDILKLVLGIPAGSAAWNQHILPTDAPVRNAGDYSESDLLAVASQRRPEIQNLQKSLEKSKLDTVWARNQRLPQLDFVGSYSLAGTAGDYFRTSDGVKVNQSFPDAWSQVGGFDYDSWTVGLQFTYPLFNRAAKYTYSVYRLAQSATEIQLDKMKQTIANDVRLSLRNLQTTEKRIAASELNLKLQQEKLAAEQKKFQNGLSTSFNVLSYQNDVTAAQSALLKARIDNQLAVADLDRAVGSYLESKKIALPEAGAPAAP